MTLAFLTSSPRRILFAVFFMGAFSCTLPKAAAEDELPQPYPDSRYESIWKKSPFTLPSAVAETNASFVDNLALAGIVRIEGENYAAIIDKTTKKRELISSTPNDQGLKLIKTEPSDDLAKVSVVLQKNGEQGTLQYDMSFLQASLAKTPENQPPTPASAPPPRAIQNQGGPPPAIRAPRRRVISPATAGQPGTVPISPGAVSPAPNQNPNP